MPLIRLFYFRIGGILQQHYRAFQAKWIEKKYAVLQMLILDVLDKAFKVIKPGGHLFIGDVRNLSLLKAYHASDSLTRLELERLVQERITQEQEFVIDPTFFMALTQKYPQLTKVQIQLKRGDHHNELTRFRYDVILQGIIWCHQPLSP